MPNQTDILFASQAPTIVRAAEVRHVSGHRLWVKFSDGTAGEHDFSEVMSRTGPMAVPLHDIDFFAQVYVDNGALTWPNGYDLDPINLQMKMRACGELTQAAAE